MNTLKSLCQPLFPFAHFLTITCVLLLLTPVGGQEPSNDNAMLIIEDKPMATVQAGVFGQFLERPSWGGEFGPEGICDDAGRLPEPVLKMLQSLRPPVVRFPGGTDVDHMNWTDLIDHAPDRKDPARPLSKGSKGDMVTNRFGLNEFFDLRDQLGSEVILVGNLRQALYRQRPLAEAALHEAGLLAYANAPAEAALPDGMPDWGALRARNGRSEPVGVRYFMVGNESYFFWPPKNEEERERLGLTDDADAWEWFRQCLLAYGKALKAVDPDIELIIDGFHDAHNSSNDVPNTFRERLFLDPEICTLYQHLGAHHYAPMGFNGTRLKGERIEALELDPEQIWYGLISGPGLFDAQGQNTAFGDYYRAMVDAGYRVAVTEWNFNAWSTNRVLKEGSFGIEVPARLATAGFFHGILRQAGSISLTTQSMLLGTSWGITAIRADPTGETPPYWLPQGQVAQFYRFLTGSEILSSQLSKAPTYADPPQLTPWWPAIQNLSLIDAIVTRDERGLFVHLINRSLTQDLPLTVQLPKSFQAGSWKIHTLQSDPYQPFERSMELPVTLSEGAIANNLLQAQLPKHSVSIIEIPTQSR